MKKIINFVGRKLKAILGMALAVILGAFATNYAIGYDVEVSIKYISGKYGTKCYPEGQAHGNIKYPVEFDNIEDCLEYVRDN